MAWWATQTADLLWRNALSVIPLVLIVAAIIRWVPCRPTTRHALWVIVLLRFIVPPMIPRPAMPALSAPAILTPVRADALPDASSFGALARDEASVRDGAAVDGSPRRDATAGTPLTQPASPAAPPAPGALVRMEPVADPAAFDRTLLNTPSGAAARVEQPASMRPDGAGDSSVQPSILNTPDPPAGADVIENPLWRRSLSLSFTSPPAETPVRDRRSDRRDAANAARRDDAGANPWASVPVAPVTPGPGDRAARAAVPGEPSPPAVSDRRSDGRPHTHGAPARPRTALVTSDVEVGYDVADVPIHGHDVLDARLWSRPERVSVPAAALALRDEPDVSRLQAAPERLASAAPASSGDWRDHRPVIRPDVVAPAASIRDPGQAESARWAAWRSAAVDTWERLLALPRIPSGIWFGGLAVIALSLAIRIVAFRRRLSMARPAPRDLVRLVETIAGRMGLRRAPAVCVVDDRTTPMVWFGRQTRLVIPAELWTQLDAAGREAILCHELAHLKRKDHWVYWAQQIAGVLYWWHPLLWWVRRRLDEEAELCCDAWVTWLMPEGRRAYAEALLTTKQYISDPSPAAPVVGVGVMTAKAKRLARRITMVMTERVRPKLSIAGISMAFLLAFAGWTVAPAESCPPKDAKDKADAKTPCAVKAPCDVKAPCEPGEAPAVVKPLKAPKPQELLDATPVVPRFEVVVPRPMVATGVTQPKVAWGAAPRADVMAVPPLAGIAVAPVPLGDRGDGDDDLEARMSRLERQLERLSEQLDRLGDVRPRGEAPSSGGWAGVRGVEPPREPAPPRMPTPPSASRRATPPAPPAPPQPPRAGGAAGSGRMAPILPRGETISREYKLPAGKLEALSKLMVRDDVPILVSPGRGSITVQATEPEHCVFGAFVDMINSEEASEDYRVSKGKLEDLSELMVRSDVPILVSPSDDHITVHAKSHEQAIFRAFVQMIDPQSRGGAPRSTARSWSGTGADATTSWNADQWKEHVEQAIEQNVRREQETQWRRHAEEAHEHALHEHEHDHDHDHAEHEHEVARELEAAAAAQAELLDRIHSRVDTRIASANARVADIVTRVHEAMNTTDVDRINEVVARAEEQMREFSAQSRDMEREAKSLQKQAEAMQREAEDLERRTEADSESAARSLAEQIRRLTSDATKFEVQSSAMEQAADALDVAADELEAAVEQLREQSRELRRSR